MILIKQLILILLGLAFGATVAGGVFAFITMLNVVPRIADRTRTAGKIYWYEICVVAGGTAGNACSIFSTKLPISMVGMLAFGLFSGIYVGCLAMALAEVLRVIPIFTLRIKLLVGLPVVISGIAFGKLAGGLFQFFFSK